MQKLIEIGRLTRDPEVRYSQGANPTAIAKFTLAIDRKIKKEGEPTADFINHVAFGKTAEFIEKYFKQGSKIAVVGRIQTGNYTNKDGQKIYTTDVVVEEVEFAESKGSNGTEGNSPRQTSRPTPQAASNDGFMNIPDGVEDGGLPFN
jgi:single-strand DNA-binding protein